MYQVVVPSFNSMPYLEKTLESLKTQKGAPFQVCIIDDASTFQSHKDCIAKYVEELGWTALRHESNTGALKSIVDGIEALNPDDEDVIVLVDGDDWLSHDRVFETLDRIYNSGDVWMSYGQYEVHPKAWLPTRPAAAISPDVIQERKYRQIPWIFWPLRTFKAKLWRKIKDVDLRDEAGEYFRLSWDQALMFPMLEMAGERVYFVDEVLYVYNLDNPLSDFKISREEQEATTAYIRSKEPYATL